MDPPEPSVRAPRVACGGCDAAGGLSPIVSDHVAYGAHPIDCPDLLRPIPAQWLPRLPAPPLDSVRELRLLALLHDLVQGAGQGGGGSGPRRQDAVAHTNAGWLAAPVASVRETAGTWPGTTRAESQSRSANPR